MTVFIWGIIYDAVPKIKGMEMNVPYTYEKLLCVCVCGL